MFSTSIYCHVGSLQPIEPSSFFFICFSPTGKSWSGSFTLYSNCIRIAVCFFDTGRPRGTLAFSSAERKNTFSFENKDASSLACFTEAIAKWQSTWFFRRLFWGRESLTGTTLTCRFFVLHSLEATWKKLNFGSECNVKILIKIN